MNPMNYLNMAFSSEALSACKSYTEALICYYSAKNWAALFPGDEKTMDVIDDWFWKVDELESACLSGKSRHERVIARRCFDTADRLSCKWFFAAENS